MTISIPKISQNNSNDSYSPDNLRERFVSIETRQLGSDLASSFWDPIARQSSYVSWKGIPMQKDSFQVISTQQLIQELKPKTIIEFGSFRGGSALWLADIQGLSVNAGKVISIDIDFTHLAPEATKDPRIEFLQGDSNKIEELFTLEKLSGLQHPILLIEDAHINTVGILNYFHKNAFKPGDYFIVEDTNIDYNNACYPVWKETLSNEVCISKLKNLNDKITNLKNWLHDKEQMYLVDTKYIDLFGIKNATKNWNSVLKKII